MASAPVSLTEQLATYGFLFVMLIAIAICCYPLARHRPLAPYLTAAGVMYATATGALFAIVNGVIP